MLKPIEWSTRFDWDRMLVMMSLKLYDPIMPWSPIGIVSVGRTWEEAEAGKNAKRTEVEVDRAIRLGSM